MLYKTCIIQKLLKLILLFALCNSLCQGQNKTNLRGCIKKIKTEIGVKCEDCKDYKDSYKVLLINICTDTLDIQIAVQNRNKTWKIFQKNRVKPNDTIDAYSCDGAGKFLKWVRVHGDTTYHFPSNNMYPKKR